MSHTSSRTEIEQALKGISALEKRQKHTENAASLRQQHVIGGDLQGISDRQKYGVWHRTLNVIDQTSIINWAAGFVFLIVLSVFIWPDKTSVVKSELNTIVSEQQRSIYTQSRLDQLAPQESNSFQDNSFSRDNDLDRAAVFREQDALENAVRELLSQAEQLITDGWYTLPPENNALGKYKDVLRLDKRNSAAVQGIEYISGRFLAAGTDALSNNNEAGAVNALEKLRTIDPESQQYFTLADNLTLWRKEKEITDLLTLAEQKLASDQLIQPARSNAFYHYQEVLQLDENNSRALDGIESIVSQFVDKTTTAIFNDQLLEAQSYLETIRIMSPDKREIVALEKLIANANQISQLATQPENLQDNAKPSSNTSAQNTANQTSAVGVSAVRTPAEQTAEQQAFDRQYLSQGLAAYDKGAYRSAFALLQPLADKGVSRAQIRIANMVYAGHGVSKDREKGDSLAEDALPAIQKFADEGRVWAQTELARLYQIGLGVSRNIQKSLKWYLAAANQGYPKAQSELGLIYMRGDGVLANRRVATLWLQRAAKQGDKAAIKGLRSLGIRP